MRLERAVTGPLEVNTYILESGGDCLIVDPGCCSVSGRIRGLGCTRVIVAVTHGHFDHTAGVDCVKREFNAILAAHPLEPVVAAASAELGRGLGFSVDPQESRVDLELVDGSSFRVGGLKFRVYHTPGHSPDHVVLHSPEAGVAFTGDLLLAGTVGRFDLPGGDPEAMASSLRRIASILPRGTRILPGHGPETSIDEELESNPFLSNPDLILGI